MVRNGSKKVKKEIKAVNNVRQVRVRNGSKRSKMCPKNYKMPHLSQTGGVERQSARKMFKAVTSPPNVTRGKNVLN